MHKATRSLTCKEGGSVYLKEARGTLGLMGLVKELPRTEIGKHTKEK